jgi:hypothetical protein
MARTDGVWTDQGGGIWSRRPGYPTRKDHTMTEATVIGTDVIVTGSMYRRTPEGWESSRQIATFMLPHRTHGLMDLHHAARIAADILATYTPADTYISLGLADDTDTLSAVFQVTDDTGNVTRIR